MPEKATEPPTQTMNLIIHEADVIEHHITLNNAESLEPNIQPSNVKHRRRSIVGSKYRTADP